MIPLRIVDQSHTNEPSKSEKTHWYEDGETKKKLEVFSTNDYVFSLCRWLNQQIGGGIAAGAALLAGGLFAYKKHEEHKEEVTHIDVS